MRIEQRASHNPLRRGHRVGHQRNASELCASASDAHSNAPTIELRRMFRDADYINGYVVFNIRQNRDRFVTVIHYSKTTNE